MGHSCRRYWDFGKPETWAGRPGAHFHVQTILRANTQIVPKSENGHQKHKRPRHTRVGLSAPFFVPSCGQLGNGVLSLRCHTIVPRRRLQPSVNHWALAMARSEHFAAVRVRVYEPFAEKRRRQFAGKNLVEFLVAMRTLTLQKVYVGRGSRPVLSSTRSYLIWCPQISRNVRSSNNRKKTFMRCKRRAWSPVLRRLYATIGRTDRKEVVTLITWKINALSRYLVFIFARSSCSRGTRR